MHNYGILEEKILWGLLTLYYTLMVEFEAILGAMLSLFGFQRIIGTL